MPDQGAIGFVGIGAMGWPMAANLVRRQFSVTVYDVDRARQDRFVQAHQSRSASSLADLGKDVSVIVTMLPTGRDVRHVLLTAEEGALTAALKPGAVVIDMSSSDPAGTRELAATLAKRGVVLIDAPVSGGTRGAEAASLTIMIGSSCPSARAPSPRTSTSASSISSPSSASRSSGCSWPAGRATTSTRCSAGSRSAAQMVSYEIPLTLSIVGAVVLAGTLSFSELIAWQLENGWLLWWQPVGLAIFYVASLAEINRTPFDMVEADSELVAGPFTEYSGMRFGFFFFAEYVALFIMSGILITLFFGGWLAPWPLPAQLGGFAGTLYGIFWFFLKTYIFVAIAVWLRGTLPRVRVDQLMGVAWKVLLPLALVNLFITAIAVVVFEL